MKINVIGGYACSNRGDCAILRGLLEGVESLIPSAEIETENRFPETSTKLLGRHVHGDLLYRWCLAPGSKIGSFQRKLIQHVFPGVMALAIRTRWKWLLSMLPPIVKNEIKRLSYFDVIILMGGSYFIHLYGRTHFIHSYAAILSGTPVVAIGHSVGPFGGPVFRWLFRTLLGNVKTLSLRESRSRLLMEASGISTINVSSGSDTAWLVSPPPSDERKTVKIEPGRPLIAVTLRDLKPFSSILGVTQHQYELAFAKLINLLITKGHRVVAVPMCTSLGGYHHDDRISSMRVNEFIREKEYFHVISEDLDDIGLGRVFHECQLVVATRLHSAIIAMNFGTPAIAIGYEHKAEGIFEQLGLSELFFSMQSLLNGEIGDQAFNILDHIEDWKEKISRPILIEKARSKAALKQALYDFC